GWFHPPRDRVEPCSRSLTGWCRSPRREVGNLHGVYLAGRAFCQRTQRLVVLMAVCQNGFVSHWARYCCGLLPPTMAVGSGYFGDGFWWHVTPVLLGPLVPVQHPLAVLEGADWNSLGWHSSRCQKCPVVPIMGEMQRGVGEALLWT